MPKVAEKYIPSFDGLLLLYRRFEPSTDGEKIPIRASLCLVHGFGEHSDRYPHVCEGMMACRTMRQEMKPHI
jgi:alpha-beta hydrolase superfamily lysophospholipase